MLLMRKIKSPFKYTRTPIKNYSMIQTPRSLNWLKCLLTVNMEAIVNRSKERMKPSHWSTTRTNPIASKMDPEKPRPQAPSQKSIRNPK